MTIAFTKGGGVGGLRGSGAPVQACPLLDLLAEAIRLTALHCAMRNQDATHKEQLCMVTLSPLPPFSPPC